MGVAPILSFKEPVFRPRQAEIFAQRLAFIFAPEDFALLQFGYDFVDEIVEPGRQIREHDVKAVAAETGQPFLHLIDNGLWRPDERQPAIAADALRELAYREFFAGGEVDLALT